MTALTTWIARATISALLITSLSVNIAFADGQRGFTRQEAIREAQKRNGGGKVLGISEQKRNGKSVYSVKVISNGKVREHRLPAR